MIQLKNILLMAFAGLSFSVNADCTLPPAPSWSSGSSYSCFTQEQDICHHIPLTAIKDGISLAVPTDLFEVANISSRLPLYAIGRQGTETSESWRKSKNDTVDLVGFKAVTDDYGQLKSILDANKGSEIDSLVVVGPMNKDDFKAIWDCAVYGNMQVLNLEYATMENNAIPDYAMYDPIQFETGFWLKMRRIILPEGVVSIGKAAFPFMGVEKINIPSTVREIGSTAFGYDRWLNCEIVIPEGVEEIKYQTFIECNRLTIAPKLPKSLKKIGEHAFSMTRFDNLTFPDYLEEIGAGAFQDCGLTDVHLPETCLVIGDMAFQLSEKIKDIVMPTNLEYIPFGLFSMCNGLERLNIHTNCRRIEDSAFLLCTNLREINFNPNIETIGFDAFYGCALISLNLPSSLRQLGASSFGAMYSTLHEVRCAANIPPKCIENPLNPEELPFSPPNENEEFTLYVPIGTKTAYSTTWGWDCFFKIEETDKFPWTSLEEIRLEIHEGNNTIYDLQGRVIKNPSPGQIYIVNGHKIIAK